MMISPTHEYIIISETYTGSRDLADCLLALESLLVENYSLQWEDIHQSMSSEDAKGYDYTNSELK